MKATVKPWSVTLSDGNGDRQHTLYLNKAPEYGKVSFKERYDHAIRRLKELYPTALYLGFVDGTKENGSFIKPHTERQLFDFYHVTDYLAKASYPVYP